ncbi:membrane protein [Paenibacillus albidus]|uniref:Membrane protein n=1 Tax=Paenibacillus albidus TaxID=2041023 RepID=A0A917CI60_9BACL|nr:DoxX-like family protein [Paenibacillus albidus]GGF89315.1 membrane protein [Paenibacillus albidus]
MSSSSSKPIYVEILIKAGMQELWDKTQDPRQHEQWDLRFSRIEYLPRTGADAPQRFRYSTKIGFGLSISGEGETSGRLLNEQERISSLKFGSEQQISLISVGSGYWKYVQETEGVRFLTLYNYKTRFGRAGQWLDRVCFRPLMGWATAWSFDCLRLWLERQIPPAESLRKSLTHALSTLLLAMIWIYQGLVPKLLVPDSGEMEMLRGIPVLQGYEQIVLTGIGVGEILFGLAHLLWNRHKWLYLLNIIGLLVLGFGAISNASVYVAPFNPVSLNLAMIGLAVTAMLSLQNLPSARACIRVKGSSAAERREST